MDEKKLDGFHVRVRDNYNFDEYNAGVFPTEEEAIAKCESIVDEFINDSLKKNPGANPKDLFQGYKMYGEDPWVSNSTCGFSAWTYARKRIVERLGEFEE